MELGASIKWNSVLAIMFLDRSGDLSFQPRTHWWCGSGDQWIKPSELCKKRRFFLLFDIALLVYMSCVQIRLIKFLNHILFAACMFVHMSHQYFFPFYSFRVRVFVPWLMLVDRELILKHKSTHTHFYWLLFHDFRYFFPSSISQCQ